MAVDSENELQQATNEPVAAKSSLMYGIDDNPPIYLAMILGFQHYLTMFGATVGIPFLLSESFCLGGNPEALSEILSSLFFVSGIVTLLQSTFGVRLPIVQGGTFTFISPTIAILKVRGSCPTSTAFLISMFFWDILAFFCDNKKNLALGNIKMLLTFVKEGPTEGDPEWKLRMREIQGAIMISSLFQIVIGFSGLIGFVLKFIGPLTIAPTIALVTLPLFGVAADFAGDQWGIAFITMACITVFSQVLHNLNVPLGCAKIKLFKLFPILLAIMIGWLISYILTVTDVFKEGSTARTDYRSKVLQNAEWFRVPYPGQWGTPTVTTAGVFGMLAGVLASMIESIGDYYACARLAEAPPPPKHALNRGIGVEGIGCLLAGAIGTGNGTTSYSENIGAIGITRVGSVRAIQCGAIIMVLLSVIGKFGALFVTIPNPVIGGIFVLMFGMIMAFGLSSLQFVDLNSMRNLFVLGTSLFFGMVLPYWVKANKEKVSVGVKEIDDIIQVLLMTNMAVGGVTGFILDNLLPGTKEERGIIKWQKNLSPDGRVTKVSSIHVYDPPFLTKRFMRSRISYYIPFLPYYDDQLSSDIETNAQSKDDPVTTSL